MMKQFLIFLFLTVSLTSIAQQNYNQHNPYVSNSEIHWLRQQEINLFNTPIVNDEFTQNVRKTIDYNELYNKESAKFGTSLTFSAIFLLVGTVGVVKNAVIEEPSLPSGQGMVGTQANPTDLKSLFIVSGVAGAINSLFTFKIYKQRKELRSIRDQQIEITKNQYNLLIGG